MKLLLLFFCCASAQIEYIGEGFVSFTGSTTIELCGNDTTGITCENLNFINATLYLEVFNDFNNVFFIDEDYTNWYVGFYNQTITDDGDIQIISFGPNNVSYYYVAYYSQAISVPIPTVAVNYSGEGTVTFTNYTSIVLCGNNPQDVCDNLIFNYATIQLTISNNDNNIFLVGTTYYSGTYNQTYYDGDVIGINSYGLSNLTYSYISYLIPYDYSSSSGYYSPPTCDCSNSGGVLAAVVLSSLAIIFSIGFCVIACYDSPKCKSWCISCIDKIKNLRQ